MPYFGTAHAIGEYGSWCGDIRGCLNLTVVVNSTTRNTSIDWIVYSNDNKTVNFYVQPAILQTSGANNTTSVFNEKYDYSANATPINRIINISNAQSVSSHYQVSYYFTYFNSTLGSLVHVSSANFNGSENYPALEFNKTAGDLKSGANTSILVAAVLPAPNNPLYNSLIEGNVLNSTIIITVDPIAPVVHYMPENGAIQPYSNYTIHVTATLPENFTLYHVWYSKSLATVLPNQSSSSGGAVISVGTAKNVYVKGVTTSTVITTTIATIPTTIPSAASQAASATNPSRISASTLWLAIAAIAVLIVLVMAWAASKGKGKKKKGR
ncbi:MAG: hypothetical protein KGI06_05495 [Candidatus Micrarchaeota archaeon]|nr:hypothetical protein [Candidatus Micrarchaeota archaeon]